MDEREKEFKKLSNIKKIKLIRLALKLKKKLCNSCKEGAKSGDFTDYCSDCYSKNKKIFDKMNELTGEN